MAGRGHQSFEKRQRERAKQERQALKREQRAERKNPKKDDEEVEENPSGLLTEEQLFEQFRILSERHQNGDVDDEDFEVQKAELFDKLGLASE